MSVLVDSNSLDVTAYSILGDAAFKIGQSFTNNQPDCNISSCKFYLFKEGTIEGNVEALLYNHDGTYGESSVPTGSVLATSESVSVSNIPSLPALIEFNFTETVNLISGGKYVIALDYSGSDMNNYIAMGRALGHSGNGCFYQSLFGWDYNNTDYIFYIYGNLISPTISNISSIYNISSIHI